MDEERRCVPLLVAVVVVAYGFRVLLALSYCRVSTRAVSDYECVRRYNKSIFLLLMGIQ